MMHYVRIASQAASVGLTVLLFVSMGLAGEWLIAVALGVSALTVEACKYTAWIDYWRARKDHVLALFLLCVSISITASVAGLYNGMSKGVVGESTLLLSKKKELEQTTEALDRMYSYDNVNTPEAVTMRHKQNELQGQVAALEKQTPTANYYFTLLSNYQYGLLLFAVIVAVSVELSGLYLLAREALGKLPTPINSLPTEIVIEGGNRSSKEAVEEFSPEFTEAALYEQVVNLLETTSIPCSPTSIRKELSVGQNRVYIVFKEALHKGDIIKEGRSYKYIGNSRQLELA